MYFTMSIQLLSDQNRMNHFDVIVILTHINRAEESGNVESVVSFP